MNTKPDLVTNPAHEQRRVRIAARNTLMAVAVATSIAGGKTWADQSEGFGLHVSETLSYDDNLFRLPSGLDPTPLTGKSDRATWIRTDLIGFGFDKLYSQQDLHLNVDFAHSQYYAYRFLDFTAKNANFSWNWAITPRLTGVISADRKQVLDSFTDYRKLTTRNIRTNDNRLFALDFEALGPWHLLGSVSRYSSIGDDTSVAAEDQFSSESALAGVKYLFDSTSSLSYVVRRESGRYPDQTLQASLLSDTQFRQIDHQILATWKLTEKTVLNGRLTESTRQHPHFSERNYSAGSGRLDLTWLVTQKVSLMASAGRELSTYQTPYSNYIATDSISISPNWQITPKTSLNLRASRSRRNYLGEPFGALPLSRRDHLHSERLEFTWQATRAIGLVADLLHDSRSSNYPALDFSDTTAMLSFRFTL